MLFDLVKQKFKSDYIINQEQSLYFGKINDRDYLHLFRKRISDMQEKEFVSWNRISGSKFSQDLINLLKEHNGAVLYSGSIRIFGWFDQGTSKYYSSIKFLTDNDYISINNNKLIYFANAPYTTKENINFYFDTSNGNVIGLVGKTKIINIKSIKEFERLIYKFYDFKYNSKGIHIKYDDKENYVSKNIQLFKGTMMNINSVI